MLDPTSAMPDDLRVPMLKPRYQSRDRRPKIFCLDTLDQTRLFRSSLGRNKWLFSNGLYISVQGVQGVQGEFKT